MKMINIRTTCLLLLFGIMLASCGQATTTTTTTPTQASTTSPIRVRLAYFPNLTHAVALVGTARGTFKDALGANVNLDVKTFNAGPALIEALFAGEIDIGYVGPNPAINGYVKSKGDALRIIAGASSGGALFIVRPEAKIATANDLRGKKLATPQLGGTQDVALRYYIQQAGLKTADKGGDVTITPLQNPDILTQFKQGKIDGAWVPEPWASRLLIEANGQVLVDERTIWPDGKFTTTVVIVHRAFLAAHPDLVEAFLKAHVETVQYIASNPDESKKLINDEIARITTQPVPAAILDKALATTDITSDPIAKSLFVSADHAFALGFLGDTKPDLSGIFALDLLNKVLTAKGLPTVANS